MIVEAVLAGTVGGILSLDRFQICQVMVSRPLVSASIVGWVLGDLSAGLASGILFETLWLRTPPIGGYVPPDGTLASIATAAVAAIVRANTGASVTAVACLAFLLLFPLALLGAFVDIRFRRILGLLAQKAEGSLADRPDRVLVRYFLASLGLGLLFTFMLLFPAILGAGLALTYVVAVLPLSVLTALGTAYYVVPLVGVADLMVRLDERQDVVLFFLGIVAAFAAALALT
jgi:mannose PTS system EIIC component